MKTITKRQKKDALSLLATRDLSHELCVKLVGWLEGEMKHRALKGDRRHADTVFVEFIQMHDREIRECHLRTKA